MLELSKFILKKVSFDRNLFQKELEKAVKWITKSDDLISFKNYCMDEYGKKYPLVLKRVFNNN